MGLCRLRAVSIHWQLYVSSHTFYPQSAKVTVKQDDKWALSLLQGKLLSGLQRVHLPLLCNKIHIQLHFFDWTVLYVAAECSCWDIWQSDLCLGIRLFEGGVLNEAGSTVLVALLRGGQEVHSLLQGYICHASRRVHTKKSNSKRLKDVLNSTWIC